MHKKWIKNIPYSYINAKEAKICKTGGNLIPYNTKTTRNLEDLMPSKKSELGEISFSNLAYRDQKAHI